jgi:hypothetical protein
MFILSGKQPPSDPDSGGPRRRHRTGRRHPKKIQTIPKSPKLLFKHLFITFKH